MTTKTAKEKIFDELIEIMAVLLKLEAKEIEEITNMDSNLRDDLGIDSVESLDFLTAIEKLYSIKILDEEAVTLKKVSDVIDLILKKTPSR